MAKSQTIARLGVQLGLDSAEFKSGASNAVVETKNLRNSIAREMRAAEKEIQTLKYATEDYGKTITRVAQLEREIEAGRFKNLSGSDKGQEVLNRLRAQAKAYDDIAAKSKSATTGGLTSQQQLQLTYQTTDFVTQVASGQNAMIALLQQGGQLKDSMGGFAGMFRALGTLITPLNVGIAALAVTVGTLGFAFYKGAQESARLRDDLILTGRYAGLTQKSFYDLAATLSDGTNASIGETKEILGALVSSGKFASESIGSVARAIAIYSDLSGKTAQEATQELMSAFDGTASSAYRLNERFHFLTLQQYKQIVALEKLGKTQEAIKVLADAFNKKMEDQHRNLGALEKAWNALGKAASWAWDKMLGIGRDEDLDQKIERLAKQVGQRALHLQVRTASGQVPKEQLDALKAQLLADQEALRQAVLQKQERDQQTDAQNKENELVKNEKEFGQKRLQLNDQLQDQLAKNNFEYAKANALELEKIELDTQEKIRQAVAKRDRSNRDAPALADLHNAIMLAEIKGAANDKEIRMRQYSNELADKARKARVEEAEEFDRYQSSYYEHLGALMDGQALKEKGLLADREMLELESRRYTMTDQAFRLEQQILQVEQQRKEAIDQINKMSLSPEDRAAALKRENAYWDERLGIVREFARLTGRRAGTAEQGFLGRLSEELQKLPNDFEIGQSAFESMVNSMDSSLRNFVQTGKLNFKDFARSIVQDLMFIQLKIAAMKLLEAVLGNFGFKLPGKATGGPVESGNAYVVGEKGPEMFIPRSSGTIIPNHQLAASGGGSTNITYNINAIDVQSFEQRLMGSSTAIWAANMYAQKRLPVTGGRM